MSNWSTKHDDAVHGVTITAKQADRVIHAAKDAGIDARKALELARSFTGKPGLRCLMDLTSDQANRVIEHIRSTK